ncbi:MAG: MBL fold metallo-hydrolase [Deltaproteobacteria bacterium]|nr:MBL fold metallo-hydrolase [Deltaproteobacteria bacterium]MBW2345704.1 MBL fold metallo-hydrolase [Deltaproteobacteria bacterium]
MIKVTCLGGAGSVTGSGFLVETPQGKRALVDCGLFQGGRQMESRNREDWGFDPKDLNTLFLTHAHIDHSGRIPKLVKEGFKGKIITSPPTAELSRVMLLDSAHIQEMDAEWQTRKNKRRGKEEVKPLYTMEDAEASLKLLTPTERDRIIEVEPGIRARLRNAGHILGSSILELWLGENGNTTKVVFSGDLGKHDQLILRDPHEIFDADYLFVESTYGNRMHRSFGQSKDELLEAIRYSVSKNEKIIIPAFAVERTQELLYLLGEFDREGLLPDIPVYLDSPLAIKATEIFRKNKKYYDEEARAIVDEGYDPFDLPNLKFTESTQESIAINERPGSAIIIAGSGMCTAGRIKHHLKHNLWREGASLVIVGFQAKGTTGRKIVDGAKHVKVFRENVSVKAKVFTIGGFSAHADQKDLLEWIGHFESNPRVFVIHGEATASEALAKKIKDDFNLTVHVPKWKERLILKPREVTIESTEAPEPLPDMKEVLSNTIIDLESELKALKKRIKSKEAGEKIEDDDVDQLKYIQEELKEILS